MESIKPKRYIFLSSVSSFILPILLIILFILFGLGPPESDSGEVQGVVFTVMTFPFIFAFQLLAYALLGNAQLRREKPSKLMGVIAGAVLSVPLTVFALSIALVTGATIFQAVFGAISFMFLPLLLSFSVGAMVQCYCMGRHA